MNDQIKMGRSWQRGFEAATAASIHSTGIAVGQKLGAALYSGSNLLSIGFNDWNKTTRHSQNIDYNGNTHAEVMALVRRWHYDKTKNLIMYVSRYITNSQQTIIGYGCSRPCNSCMRLIVSYGVRRVRFFDENGEPREIKF
jgi:deoxycytidylate deaminase